MTKLLIPIHVPGPVAENKQWARLRRERSILPKLREGHRVVLDFRDVSIATQSFVHACISKAVAELGEDCLEKLEFRACTPEVRAVIESVVEYSLRARMLTNQGLSSQIEKKDVPQADSLPLIRAVIDALAAGSTTPKDVAASTKFSFRHVHYRLHAARVLGLVKFVRHLASLTPRGVRLARTAPDSKEERRVLEEAIFSSRIMKALVPALLGQRPPSAEKLALHLQHKTGLRPATALRRAKALLAWRRSLVQTRLL